MQPARRCGAFDQYLASEIMQNLEADGIPVAVTPLPSDFLPLTTIKWVVAERRPAARLTEGQLATIDYYLCIGCRLNRHLARSKADMRERNGGG